GGENAVGYVWLELRHRDTGQAVTLGVGLHAARHRDTPVRWHFVADGRVGTDFSLITGDDRPMTRKQLADEIGDSSLYASATDYRAAIDQRLFGLGRERYEQLLTLILTLRRPQLAKNLDPAKLCDTLSDGQSPAVSRRRGGDALARRGRTRRSRRPRRDLLVARRRRGGRVHRTGRRAGD